jgi:hypothetical protein
VPAILVHFWLTASGFDEFRGEQVVAHPSYLLHVRPQGCRHVLQRRVSVEAEHAERNHVPRRQARAGIGRSGLLQW